MKEIIIFLKKYLKKEKKLIFIAITLTLIESLLSLCYGYLSGLAISKVTEGLFSIGIVILLINLIIYVVNSTIFSRLSQIISTKASLSVMKDINYDLFSKILRLPTRAFEEKSNGEYINRITNDSEDITNSIASLIKIIIRALVCLIIFIYATMNSLIVGIEIVFFLLIFYKITKVYNPKLKSLQKEIKKENDFYIARVSETIRGMREIRALGINKNILKDIKEIVQILFKKRNKTIKFEHDYYALMDILSETLITVIYITCIINIFLSRGTLTFLIAMTYYVYNFMNLVNSYASFSASFQKLKISVGRIYEIINNKLYEDVKFGDFDNKNIFGNIEFNNVSFNYHDNKHKVLDNFNLKVNSNSKIAIIGKSGQGKSTIFNLLLRYFDATSGNILIDNINIKDYNEDSLRSNISIIRQDPFLFNRSIIENFYMVNPKIKLKNVRAYCKKAGIDDYIMSLPNKYNTKIGEDGINLSGGQKQRIAIARALSKNSKIILFDEATSSLDNESQKHVIDVINDISKDHTIITIAHRLSTIIDADAIYVMENGSIVASGTHKELLKNNKIYQDLYENQN